MLIRKYKNSLKFHIFKEIIHYNQSITTIRGDSVALKRGKGKKKKIAVVFWFQKDSKIKEHYYSQVLDGITKASEENDIEIKVIYNDNFLFDKELFSDVDGIIAVGKFGSRTVKLFEECSKNLVFVDFSPNRTKYDSVVIDFRNAVESVLRTLILKGYDRIGYLGGVEYVDDQTKLGERRGIVFKDFLKKEDMYYKEHMHLGKFSSVSGYLLMREAIKKGNIADVYFCGDDSICQGALKAIHEAGLRVPENVGLIGFHDAPDSEKVFPALSSVHVHTEMIGEQAVLSLLDQINETRNVPIRKVIPTYIKHRRSLI